MRPTKSRAKNPEKVKFPRIYYTPQLFKNNKKCLMDVFSEGSCDTEDWNNDAENSALHHRNKLYIKIY